MSTLRDRIERRAASAYVAATMARMPERETGGQWLMTVAKIVDVAANVRRITFYAEQFRGYRANGPDEYFGLLMPRGGTLTMPDADEANLRRAVQALPEHARPELRWYSLRAIRPDAGEVDVDIVLHGDAGPGSAWALRVEVGDQAAFRQHTALYLPAGDGDQLLVADETGAPALAAIVDAHPDPAQLTVVVEVPDRTYLSPLPDSVDAVVVERGAQAPGAAGLAAIEDMDLPALDYAWICGEHELATGVRRHLVKERDLDRKRVMFSSFWTVGKARV